MKENQPISRRQFLKLIPVAVGALALTSCDESTSVAPIRECEQYRVPFVYGNSVYVGSTDGGYNGPASYRWDDPIPGYCTVLTPTNGLERVLKSDVRDVVTDDDCGMFD